MFVLFSKYILAAFLVVFAVIFLVIIATTNFAVSENQRRQGAE